MLLETGTFRIVRKPELSDATVNEDDSLLSWTEYCWLAPKKLIFFILRLTVDKFLEKIYTEPVIIVLTSLLLKKTKIAASPVSEIDTTEESSVYMVGGIYLK